MLDVLECDRAGGVPLLGRQDLAGGLNWVTALDQRDDDLGARILPSRIPDGDEVGVAPQADSVQDLPGRVEQRVVRV